LTKDLLDEKCNSGTNIPLKFCQSELLFIRSIKMKFSPKGATTLIGSLPHADRKLALDLVFKYCPEIPSWPQLVKYKPEQMIPQFCQNLPGLKEINGTLVIDTQGPNFEEEFLAFFEEYLMITEGEKPLDNSRFVLSEESGKTFRAFLDRLKNQRPPSMIAVKGQITGPFTMLTSIVDQNKRYILYDDRASDMVVKSLSLQARWQTETLNEAGVPVIIFLDEPALSGFGSSAFISVSASRIHEIINELAGQIHQAGGLVGTHVCANTDWNLIFDSDVDVLNFDAYGYFDRFALYKEKFHSFLESDKIVAWGIVPTMNPGDIESATVKSLKKMWIDEVKNLMNSKLNFGNILSHSIITPSCGCGSLSEELAEKVLELNLEVSEAIKKELET